MKIATSSFHDHKSFRSNRTFNRVHEMELRIQGAEVPRFAAKRVVVQQQVKPWLQAPAGGCAVHPRRRQDQIGRRVRQPIGRPRWSAALLPEQHATHRYGRRSHFASPARLATVAQCRPDMSRTGQAPEPGRSERAEIRRQAAEAGVDALVGGVSISRLSGSDMRSAPWSPPNPQDPGRDGPRLSASGDDAKTA
jgi:hypothetical protein